MIFYILLILAVLFLLYLLSVLYSKNKELEQKLAILKSSKTSQSVKYGKTMEQWAPFLEDFPYSYEKFKFIGDPIDGIIFDDNKIIFCEIKSSSSSLSQKQKKIKKLVEDKKIDWLEFRINYKT